MMGKKQNLSHLTDEERDKIMQVLQKDFELRRAEKKVINEAHDELAKEKNRIAVLKEKDKFNENSCIICLERFGVLFHRKRKCYKCDLNVCSECSQARDKKKKGFICKVCSKEKAYKMLSNEWFYHNSHTTDKNSGSSRIVRWLYKKQVPDPADTDVDSGYNQSSCSSAGPGKSRARLDNVFDIKIKESLHEELPQSTSEDTSLSNPEPLEDLSPDQPGNHQLETFPETSNSDHPPEETIAEASHEKHTSSESFVPKIVPRLRTSVQSNIKSQSPSMAVPIPRSRNIKEHFLALDTETIDRTKKTEESSFRVEFDKLLRDLYETLNDEELGGHTTNTESPSYEDMMRTFKDNVTNILKGFTERLQVAYEKCTPVDIQMNHREKVQQDVCKFIGSFIGENVNMTSEAAMSDFFSAVKNSSHDDISFEDLLAQAVVSKLFDNHYDEVREALWSSNKSSVTDPNRQSFNSYEEACDPISASDDDPYNGVNDEDCFTEESDINTELQEMKEFVKNTSQRPRIEVSAIDDSSLCEVNEDAVVKTEVDRDEDREEFCARYSILDRIHNPTLTLPDISYFESGEVTDETDPDLLSLNLAIIPEETEEEAELDTDRKTNWSFMGKNVPTNENLLKTNEQLSPRGSFRMRVPIPDNVHIPKIGHRNIDQLSDFSDLEGSDDEENTFYANTSKELARIAKQRGQFNTSYQLSDDRSEDSDLSGRFKEHQLLKTPKTKTEQSGSSDHNSETNVESISTDIKLLQSLIPAENDDPIFLVPPEGATIQEGEPVKFSCRVGGTGHIDVFWYREGTEVEELEDSSDVEISCEGDRQSIVLYNVTKKLGGQYMCIAVNEKGKTIQYFVLIVKDNKLEFKKPEFLKGLKDVEVTEGQSVKFRVKVKGYPQPRVNWYKDGKLLKNSILCRIEKFGNRDYTLAIDHVSMNDDAEYTVIARNVAGEEMMTAQIIVEPKSDLPARRQTISSTTTSGVSDSDSDRPLSYHNLMMNRNSRNVASFPSTENIAHTFTSASTISLALKQHEGQLKVNPEDDKKTFAQKQIETPGRRLLTDNELDALRVAEDIIQQEPNSSHSATNQTSNTGAFDSTNNEDNGNPSAALYSSPNQVQNSQLEDFYLPDSLDDCELPESPGQNQYSREADFPDIQKHKQQVLLDKCSRDFEVALSNNKQLETLSYGPTMSTIEIRVDRNDKMSTDFEVPKSSTQDHPLPIINVKNPDEVQTSENQPDYRQDKSVCLPSVDKLKEVFSTGQDDDDIEVGTLKRVHSITARNVPMEQLEALRGSHQSLPSSTSSFKCLDVPVSSSTASNQTVPESQLTHSKSSSPSSDLRLPSSCTNSPSLKHRHSFTLPTKETFTTLDVQREPVLIYLKTNPEDTQQNVKPQTERLVPESNQQKPATQRHLAATKDKKSNQIQQSKITTQAFGQHHRSDTVHSSGPRIKGGCISARTAFWERKIAQGEIANQEEFPDMVEDNDS